MDNNTLNEEEIERCTLRGTREIIFQLRGLIKRGERVSVNFHNGDMSFLTVLIDISEDHNSLYFDVSGSEETNRAFLKSGHCVFIANAEGIRHQFSAEQAREAILRGDRVFAVPLPESLLRLQRREFFRLELPTANPYICRIRRGTPQEKALVMHDISVGGIGALSHEAIEFEEREILQNCWIDLRDTGTLAATLEIRHTIAFETRTGKPMWHIGCRFVKLSSLNETLIQRFMSRQQAERKALAKD